MKVAIVTEQIQTLKNITSARRQNSLLNAGHVEFIKWEQEHLFNPLTTLCISYSLGPFLNIVLNQISLYAKSTENHTGTYFATQR